MPSLQISNIQADLPLLSEHDVAAIRSIAEEHEIDFISLTFTKDGQDVEDMRWGGPVPGTCAHGQSSDRADAPSRASASHQLKAPSSSWHPATLHAALSQPPKQDCPVQEQMPSGRLQAAVWGPPQQLGHLCAMCCERRHCWSMVGCKGAAATAGLRPLQTSLGHWLAHKPPPQCAWP